MFRRKIHTSAVSAVLARIIRIPTTFPDRMMERRAIQNVTVSWPELTVFISAARAPLCRASTEWGSVDSSSAFRRAAASSSRVTSLLSMNWSMMSSEAFSTDSRGIWGLMVSRTVI